MNIDVSEIYQSSPWRDEIAEDLEKAGFVKNGDFSFREPSMSRSAVSLYNLFEIHVGRNEEGTLLRNLIRKNLKIEESRKSMVKAFREYKSLLEGIAELERKTLELLPLTKELLLISEKCGVWPECYDAGEGEVKVIVTILDLPMDRKGGWGKRAWIIENGISQKEVCFFPNECRIADSLWACKVIPYKKLFRAVGKPRPLIP
jgi:hypothetical protein